MYYLRPDILSSVVHIPFSYLLAGLLHFVFFFIIHFSSRVSRGLYCNFFHWCGIFPEVQSSLRGRVDITVLDRIYDMYYNLRIILATVQQRIDLHDWHKYGSVNN